MCEDEKKEMEVLKIEKSNSEFLKKRTKKSLIIDLQRKALGVLTPKFFSM